jgi:hypothetical protein
MLKSIRRVSAVVASTGAVLLAAPVLAHADGVTDLTSFGAAVTANSTALVAVVAASFGAAIVVGTLYRGAPVAWKAFWRLIGR